MLTSLGFLERISLTPPLRVWRSEVNRVEPALSSPGGREGTDVPRGDPVHGVGIVRDLDAMPVQFVSKSYRPRTGGRRRRRQRRDPLGEIVGRADQRLPEASAVRPVERREDLAAAGVEQRQARARGASLGQRQPDRVERADAADRQPEAGGQAAGGGDPDPQPDEGPRAEADRDPLDPPPAAGGGCGRLDLAQQRGRVTGAAAGGGAQQRLVQRLAVAPGAGGGVGGRGVEADERQRNAASSP